MKYTYEGGRSIARDGVPIAYVSGVTVDGRTYPESRYAIGHPADLDDFARRIVVALNCIEIAEEEKT